MISIKSAREIELMKNTCALAASTLEYIEEFIKPGVSTEDLNKLCHDYIVKNGAYPSPLNYNGFPKSVCTSLNEVICHGIPSKKDVLKNGDILNIDVTTYLQKFHGDTNKTFFVGEVNPELKKLVEVTYQCMREGIRQVRPGARIGDIGAVIQEIAHDHGYGVVEEYCGHGIGREFHEEPQIVHVGKRGTGPEMKPGMTFTIEPMINLGRRHSRLLKDGWTVVTQDGKYSAQFEHTILVTEEGQGHEILTLRKEEMA
ncbi:MAG: type I methionyl aminopeptidase [Bdellovibrionales bacterium CG12_big_fil_rev_8_21_14_0_65_38_15]|nr:MAG: type I methionyl aminopeptidase [Bdellovibrionales bacterium CG22_combo_CG10-13_8_21_14_all_38_13]PIQ54083.1 MAG: type I methionyl aminopeptidase [Bdellovibrionales bacterium CG12_big_fil_rev_8_21_14_0_65_38_15]PIR28608.1 MAG: type I methionyl aminopeptidase [Bdellovibrionales bacterium CG11_big_fil_rev_8_21_14_0_20_38_13]